MMLARGAWRRNKASESVNNKHGLSRHISADVKREVRRRCGFGCVICGSFIVHYDHHSPEFTDAIVHDPDCITLLCPCHHAEKTNGVIPQGVLRNAIANPAALRGGRAVKSRPYFSGIPSVIVGTNEFHDCPAPIALDDRTVLLLREPEEGSGITRISALFTDSDGNDIFSIIDNEWQVPSTVYDFESIGNTIRIRSAKRNVIFQITVQPPSFIKFDRLIMKAFGHSIKSNKRVLNINSAKFHHNVIARCNIGIRIGPDVVGFASNRPIPGHPMLGHVRSRRSL